MQIAIHLEGRPKDVAAFRLGGEIPIEVKITNATKLPFAYSRDALGRLNELSFVVTDAAGTVLPPAGRNPFPEATHGMLVVAPGTSLVTTELLGLSTKIRKPGSLVVKAELAIGGMAKTETMAVRSAPVELAITAASDQELDARIHALDKSFDAARSFDQRVAILRTLICIGRRDVAKSLVSSMYSFDHPMTIEAFRFLVELPKDFREFFMATVATRGLASGMRFFLSVIVPPATPDELYNIVQSALASGHDVAEQEGATLDVSYPDDRYTPKLI